MKDLEETPTCEKQKHGIRQGCPLSPYLFICLMSVMFHDIHEDTHMKLVGAELDYFEWWELVYVDDTMLVGHRDRKINILLAASETTSAK